MLDCILLSMLGITSVCDSCLCLFIVSNYSSRICVGFLLWLLMCVWDFDTLFCSRDKSNTPSGFTLKIRKHIRTRRLEDVRQLGYDRVNFWSESFLFGSVTIYYLWLIICSTCSDYSFPVWVGRQCTLYYTGAVCSRKHHSYRQWIHSVDSSTVS